MKSIQRSSRAFTLVELLVVIGIIAILVAVLMPTLSKVREQGYRVKCLANLRSIMQAAQNYATDNDHILPYPNLGEPTAATSGGAIPAGWLYQHPLTNTLAQLKTNPGMKPQQTGVLWKYLSNPAAFRCPMDDDPDSISPTDYPVHALSSYLMNGGACGYKDTTFPAFRLARFTGKLADAVMFCEVRSELRPAKYGAGSPPAVVTPAEQLLPTDLWKDGAFTPDDGITRRHRGGGGVAMLSGAVEWWDVQKFEDEANTQVNGQPAANRLWCNPAKPDGRQ